MQLDNQNNVGSLFDDQQHSSIGGGIDSAITLNKKSLACSIGQVTNEYNLHHLEGPNSSESPTFKKVESLKKYGKAVKFVSNTNSGNSLNASMSSKQDPFKD